MINTLNVNILGLKAKHRNEICKAYPDYILKVKKNLIQFDRNVMIFTDQENEVLELTFFNPKEFEQRQRYYIPYKDFAYLEVI